MTPSRVSTRKERTPGRTKCERAISGKQDKYLPKEAYLVLRHFYQKVTAYPDKKQKKELASVIAKIPGVRGCTAAKISAYFKERRKTVARAQKPASGGAGAARPRLVIRIRIPAARQRLEDDACSPFKGNLPEGPRGDLAQEIQEALSKVSAEPNPPPKTFAELGRWCRETDTFSESLLTNIAAGMYKHVGLE